MYQGENAKFIIELEDSAGNVIPKSGVNFVEALIYGEADRRIYFKYSTVSEPNSIIISPVAGAEQFTMTVSSSQTSSLPPGRYMIKITSNTISADFPTGGLIDIEEAPIFTIVKTIKDG